MFFYLVCEQVLLEQAMLARMLPRPDPLERNKDVIVCIIIVIFIEITPIPPVLEGRNIIIRTQMVGFLL
jgi:hypothetical protein